MDGGPSTDLDRRGPMAKGGFERGVGEGHKHIQAVNFSKR